MSKKPRLGTLFDSQHAQESQTLMKPEALKLYDIFLSIW